MISANWGRCTFTAASFKETHCRDLKAFSGQSFNSFSTAMGKTVTVQVPSHFEN